jgi:hypothetical protein
MTLSFLNGIPRRVIQVRATRMPKPQITPIIDFSSSITGSYRSDKEENRDGSFLQSKRTLTRGWYKLVSMITACYTAK